MSQRTASLEPLGNAELLEGQNHVLELIAKGSPLPETLDSLLRVIESHAPGMLCSILLLDAEGVHVHHGAAPSLPESFMRSIDGEPIGPRAGSCGTAAFRREPVIVEDIATDPLWDLYREGALAHGLRACWSTPIFDAQGRVLGTFAMYFRTPGRPTALHLHLIDISTYIAAIAIVKHRESEALRASEERLRLAVTGGNIGIWEWNLETDRVMSTPQLLAMFGWPAYFENLTLNGFMDAIHPEDRPKVDAKLNGSLAEHAFYDVEFRVVLPEGSIRWIASKGRGEYDASGKPVRMMGVALEITDRKRAEEEINRREVQFVTAQRIATLGSYEWDLTTDRVHRSEELCRIFGVAPHEFKPTYQGYLERIHPDDRSRSEAIINRAFEEGTSYDFEERIVRPDGTIRMLHSQGQWTFDSARRPIKLIGICQDITDRKQTEQQLQALTARLIGAHEEERARIARELHDDLSQQIAVLSMIARNGDAARIQEKLVQLAESIHRLSHDLHPAVLEHSGLAAALQSYCSEFGSVTGITVRFQTEGSLEGVTAATALCLYRVTQEALQNVAKHAQVTLAHVDLAASSGMLRLTISDCGIGMDTTQPCASQGLGLVSIKERTRAVNGTVNIRSEPNHGTTLTVTVPIE